MSDTQDSDLTVEKAAEFRGFLKSNYAPFKPHSSRFYDAQPGRTRRLGDMVYHADVRPMEKGRLIPVFDIGRIRFVTHAPIFVPHPSTYRSFFSEKTEDSFNDVWRCNVATIGLKNLFVEGRIALRERRRMVHTKSDSLKFVMMDRKISLNEASNPNPTLSATRQKAKNSRKKARRKEKRAEARTFAQAAISLTKEAREAQSGSIVHESESPLLTVAQAFVDLESSSRIFSVAILPTFEETVGDTDSSLELATQQVSPLHSKKTLNEDDSIINATPSPHLPDISPTLERNGNVRTFNIDGISTTPCPCSTTDFRDPDHDHEVSCERAPTTWSSSSMSFSPISNAESITSTLYELEPEASMENDRFPSSTSSVSAVGSSSVMSRSTCISGSSPSAVPFGSRPTSSIIYESPKLQIPSTQISDSAWSTIMQPVNPRFPVTVPPVRTLAHSQPGTSHLDPRQRLQPPSFSRARQLPPRLQAALKTDQYNDWLRTSSFAANGPKETLEIHHLLNSQFSHSLLWNVDDPVEMANFGMKEIPSSVLDEVAFRFPAFSSEHGTEMVSIPSVRIFIDFCIRGFCSSSTSNTFSASVPMMSSANTTHIPVSRQTWRRLFLTVNSSVPSGPSAYAQSPQVRVRDVLASIHSVLTEDISACQWNTLCTAEKFALATGAGHSVASFISYALDLDRYLPSPGGISLNCRGWTEEDKLDLYRPWVKTLDVFEGRELFGGLKWAGRAEDGIFEFEFVLG